MKCPISMAMLGSYSDNVKIKPRDCLEQDCAWYSLAERECHFVLASMELYRIKSQLEKLVDVVHSDVQIRR